MDERQPQHVYQDYRQLKSKKMKYAPKQEVIKLTQKPKYLYPLFNLFQLQLNRFHSLPQFSRLQQEIVAFNKELEDWKTKDVQISNIFLTYHLYQNLFSRMKYTSSLVLDRTEAKRSYIEIERWFLVQKPKIRNKAPQKEEGQIKEFTDDRETEAEIDTLLVSHNNKRQLKVYEAMTRTSHTQFFPPKERLQEYKKRDLIQTAQTQRRATSVTTLNKGMARYRGSFTTTRTSNFKSSSTQPQTKQQPKEQKKEEPVVVPFNIQQPKQGQVDQPDQAVADVNLEKQVQQQEILQQNLVQMVHQEDQLDGEDDLQSQEQKKQQRYKKYNKDPNAEQEMIAEENIKDAKQSTLRRILKQKQQAIRRKMEELSLAQQAANWGGVKARNNSQENRKLERMHLANKYRQLQYIPQKFEEKQLSRKRDIPEFNTFQRSKSSHPGTVEQQIQKIKVNSALKTYGKYINHVNIAPVKHQTQQQKEQMRIMRSTSLTSFCKQGKRTPFSSLVEKYGVEAQNDDAMENMIKIKQRLAKTAIPVEKREILMGTCVTDIKKVDLIDEKQVFPPKKALFNNPFFPKHLYEKKAKKKK